MKWLAIYLIIICFFFTGFLIGLIEGDGWGGFLILFILSLIFLPFVLRGHIKREETDDKISKEIKFKTIATYVGGYPPLSYTGLVIIKIVDRKIILEKKSAFSSKEMGVLDIQRIVKMDFKATSQNIPALFMFGLLGGWSPKRKFILYKDPTNDKEYELEFDRFWDKDWDKFKNLILKIQYESGNKS